MKINSYINIINGEVQLNGKTLFTNDEKDDFPAFIRKVYKEFEIKYPKFYKMDTLSKLAIIGSSILLDHQESIDHNMALVLSNSTSCIDVDLLHQNSIDDDKEGQVSPANFVYTLPNICLGEISIKYKLRSENSFFIFETFNPDFLIDYTESLIKLNKTNTVLCGWVNVKENNYEAFMFLVAQDGTMELTKENLLKLKID